MESTLEFLTTRKPVREVHRLWPDEVKATGTTKPRVTNRGSTRRTASCAEKSRLPTVATGTDHEDFFSGPTTASGEMLHVGELAPLPLIGGDWTTLDDTTGKDFTRPACRS